MFQNEQTNSVAFFESMAFSVSTIYHFLFLLSDEIIPHGNFGIFIKSCNDENRTPCKGNPKSRYLLLSIGSLLSYGSYLIILHKKNNGIRSFDDLCLVSSVRNLLS